MTVLAGVADDIDTVPAPVRVWLFAVAALVFAMVLVGGATRLTGSGLSITEWQPILGAVPPLSDADWQAAFAKYKAIPQYAALNKGMSLAAFQSIYWWEWAHRFLGRFIGLAFAVPFAWFWFRGHVRGAVARRLAGILLLGGLQGAMGWYMVQSGLANRIDVSQYRLAAHLLLAAIIFACLIWMALPAGRGGVATAHRRVPVLIVALVMAQIGLGALVAGLKAGLAHDTWPLMDGRVIPSGLAAMSPWWLNVFENALTVQFDHRLLAYVLAAVIGWHVSTLYRAGGEPRLRTSAIHLALAVLIQIGLGVWTLLAHVPLHLALAHQAVAMLVLALAVVHCHRATHR